MTSIDNKFNNIRLLLIMFLGICQWFLRGPYTEYNGLVKNIVPSKITLIGKSFRYLHSMFKGMLRGLIILQSKKCLYLSSFQIQIQFLLFGKHLWQDFALSSVRFVVVVVVCLLSNKISWRWRRIGAKKLFSTWISNQFVLLLASSNQYFVLRDRGW